VVTGRAEPGSTVRVLAADGTTVLGSVVVGATGSFSITLDPPQVDGEVLQVTATDAAGNASTASSSPRRTSMAATPRHRCPDQPGDRPAGSQLSGRGEAGTTVQVRDDAGTVVATGTVNPDGTFAITLNPAITDGSTLQVTLTDAAGNVSQPGSVTAPDLLAPAQPTELALADGVTFTGRGEPGATVQVRNASRQPDRHWLGQRRRHLQRHAVPRPGQW
jgi:hypothetical protein